MEATDKVLKTLEEFKGRMLMKNDEPIMLTKWEIEEKLEEKGFFRKKTFAQKTVTKVYFESPGTVDGSFISVIENPVKIGFFVSRLETYRKQWLKLKDSLKRFGIKMIKEEVDD